MNIYHLAMDLIMLLFKAVNAAKLVFVASVVAIHAQPALPAAIVNVDALMIYIVMNVTVNVGWIPQMDFAIHALEHVELVIVEHHAILI